jgi:hypothetical protein
VNAIAPERPLTMNMEDAEIINHQPSPGYGAAGGWTHENKSRNWESRKLKFSRKKAQKAQSIVRKGHSGLPRFSKYITVTLH